jgi:hypothetical protein
MSLTADEIKHAKTFRIPYLFANEVRELINHIEGYLRLTNDDYETEFYHCGQAIEEKIKKIERIMAYAKYIG